MFDWIWCPPASVCVLVTRLLCVHMAEPGETDPMLGANRAHMDIEARGGRVHPRTGSRSKSASQCSGAWMYGRWCWLVLGVLSGIALFLYIGSSPYYPWKIGRTTPYGDDTVTLRPEVQLATGDMAPLSGKPLLTNRMVELLRNINEAMKEGNVEWLIDESTLLGQVRHGGHMPHDDDCDMIVLLSHQAAFLSTVRASLNRRGYEIYKYMFGYKIGAALTTGFDGSPSGPVYPFADVYFGTKRYVGDHVMWQRTYLNFPDKPFDLKMKRFPNKPVPASVVFPLVRRSFKGIEGGLPCPHDATVVLDTLYPKGYKTLVVGSSKSIVVNHWSRALKDYVLGNYQVLGPFNSENPIELFDFDKLHSRTAGAKLLALMWLPLSMGHNLDVVSFCVCVGILLVVHLSIYAVYRVVAKRYLGHAAKLKV